MIRCPNCLAENVPGSRVCYNCGTPLGTGAEPTVAWQPPVPSGGGAPVPPPGGWEVPPAPPRAVRRRGPWPVILAIAAAVLVLCCLPAVVLAALAITQSGPFARAAEATATPGAGSTPIVRQPTPAAGADDAAITPVVVATAGGPTVASTPTRPAATATARAPATPIPSGPQVLLIDNFDNPNSGFGTRSTAEYDRGYEGGNYVARFKQTDAFFASGPKRNFADFQLDIDCLVAMAVPTGACGVVFRWQDNTATKGDSWYKFQVDPGTGTVRFVTLVDDVQTRNWLQWVPSRAVARGTAANHLTVIADGPRIRLLVNGQSVGDFNDPTFSEGYIGLIAHGFTAPSEWHFANLRVTALR